MFICIWMPFMIENKSLCNWGRNCHTCRFSLKPKPKKKIKKRFVEVGHAERVTHLQVRVTDLWLFVFAKDSIKSPMISKIGILNKQMPRLSLGWVELLQVTQNISSTVWKIIIQQTFRVTFILSISVRLKEAEPPNGGNGSCTPNFGASEDCSLNVYFNKVYFSFIVLLYSFPVQEDQRGEGQNKYSMDIEVCSVKLWKGGLERWLFLLVQMHTI